MLRLILLAAILLSSLLLALLPAPPAGEPGSPPTHPPGRSAAAASTAAFVPNLGQWFGAFRYRAQVGAVTAFLEDDGWILDLVARPAAPPRRPARAYAATEAEAQRGAAVRLRFAGAEPGCVLVPGPRLAGVHHYFLGNDPARWRTDVPRHASVTWRRIYDGVDVTLYDKDGHLEYDLLLQPGADLARVEIEVQGAQGLRLAPDGTLVIDTAVGPLRQPPPVTWEIGADGARRAVMARAVLRGPCRFGFEVPEWRGATELLVDPGLLYSTFVGGGQGEYPWGGVAVDARGLVTLAGVTESADYPTTPGAWSATRRGVEDCFVTRLDPSRPAAQQLVFSTFLGGSSGTLQNEHARSIAVSASGVVTVAGQTSSPDFPTTANAWDQTHNGNRDVFLARLDPTLPATQQLVYSTFLGGTHEDSYPSLAVDAAGIATIAGVTMSGDFPTTTGAWDRTHNGTVGQAGDAFVARLDPSLPAAQQIVYSTYLGGSRGDAATAVAVGANGVVTIAGEAGRTDFPTTANAWKRTVSGINDGFVARLDPSLPAAQQLVYSTFVGGQRDEQLTGLAVDAAGVATITGRAWKSDFPTTANAWDRTIRSNEAYHGFVARLDPSLSAAQQLVYSTFLSGASGSEPWAIAVDPAGVVTVTGEAFSADFPTTAGAWDRQQPGGFVTRLDPSLPGGQQLVYSTFLGGSNGSRAFALAVDGTGAATIAGDTGSTDYPTTAGAFDRTHNGQQDVFVTRLDLLPTGVTRYGASSPGCSGPVVIDVSSMPQVGNASFALTSTLAPQSAPGWLAVGGAAASLPVRVLGVDLWLSLPSLVAVFPVASDGRGAARVPIPIPANPTLAGVRLHVQLLWSGPSAPLPCPPLGVSATPALEIVIQP